MNYGFNREQFHKDLDDFVKFFTGFGKSFMPSAKKVKGNEIGFFEEQYIRFRLNLVDMGISHIIRSCIVIIVGLILWATVFRKAMLDVRLILIFGFVVFYAWFMMPHLTKDDKPVSNFASVLVETQKFWVKLFNGILEFFAGVFEPFLPEQKKK